MAARTSEGSVSGTWSRSTVQPFSSRPSLMDKAMVLTWPYMESNNTTMNNRPEVRGVSKITSSSVDKTCFRDRTLTENDGNLSHFSFGVMLVLVLDKCKLTQK